MGEIATWSMIRSKISSFPAPTSGRDNECLTKSEIISMGGNGVEVSGSYGNAECVVLDNIGAVTWDYALSVSVSSLSFAAAGETKTFSVTSTKQKKVNGVNSGSPVSVGYSNSISGAGFSISGNSVSIGNNASASSRSGTVTVTQTESGKGVTVSLLQDAGKIIYGNWYGKTISVTPTSWIVGSSGGANHFTGSASRKRDYTWNGVASNGGVDTQTLTTFKAWNAGTTPVDDGYIWVNNGGNSWLDIGGITTGTNKADIIASSNSGSAREGVIAFRAFGAEEGVGTSIPVSQAVGARIEIQEGHDIMIPRGATSKDVHIKLVGNTDTVILKWEITFSNPNMTNFSPANNKTMTVKGGQWYPVSCYWSVPFPREYGSTEITVSVKDAPDIYARFSITMDL